MSTFRRADTLAQIRDTLSYIITNMRFSASTGRSDINHDTEDFYARLLNIVLSQNGTVLLKSANQLHVNYPAIDLADPVSRICVQITSVGSSSKIADTLEKFSRYGLNRDYNRLIILITGERPQYRKGFSTSSGLDFDPTRDIWGFAELIREIESLDNEKLDQILAYCNQHISNQHAVSPLNLPIVSALDSYSFVGREKELESIHRALLDSVKPIIVSGIAGSGKTELVCYFGRCYGAGNVYFVRFRESFRETLALNVAAGMSTLMERLSEQETYEVVLQRLQQCSPNDILIIDDVDGESFYDVAQEPAYRDLLNLRMHLIFTTRCNTDRSITVGRLAQEDLYQIFENHQACISQDEMDELINAVSGHTVTIDLIARTLNGKGWRKVTAKDLLRSIRENTLPNEKYRRISTDYNQSLEQAQIYQHLCSIFDVSIFSSTHRKVLCCATLLPESGIDLETFVFSFGEDHRDALDVLLDQGWLSIEDGLLRIHPIVQLVCREELRPDDENCKFFLDAIWDHYDKNAYDLQKLRQFAELFSQAADILPDKQGSWAVKAGYFWRKIGQAGNALPYEQLAVQRLELATPDSEDLAITYHNIALSHHDLSDYPKALEYFMKCLAIQEKILPADHPDLATSYNNMGYTYGRMNDHKKALDYQLKALGIWEKVLPADHPDLAASNSNVGLTYGALGNHEKSLDYQLKALRIREKVLPADHPDIAKSYNNVGGVYVKLGHYNKALEYLQKALSIRKKVLPSEHPDIANSYNNVGGVYGDLGDHKKALEYQLKALMIREKVLSVEDPNLATSYNNVGVAYGSMGNYEQALEYQLKSISILEIALPPNHPDLVAAYKNIGFVYDQLGDHIKALEYKLLSKRIQQQEDFSSDPDTNSTIASPESPATQSQWISGEPHNGVEELYILAHPDSWLERCTSVMEKYGIDVPGIYLSQDRCILLLLGVQLSQITSALSVCSNLHSLSIEDYSEIDLNLSALPRLTRLHLEYVKVDITLAENHAQLAEIKMNQCSVSNTDFLRYVPALWNLSLTAVQGSGVMLDIPDLTHCSKLVNINLAYSFLRSLGNLPSSVEFLSLDKTGLAAIPDTVQQLHNLIRLDLSRLHLNTLPLWLADLDLPACISSPVPEQAILLVNTKVDGLDLSAIPPQKELLREWLQTALTPNDEYLNEIKVIFLGDGEAGKTHLIARLKKDGEPLTPVTPGSAEEPFNSQNEMTFTGKVTPGISITDHTLDLGNRSVNVHYWDFGGQEFLHSMHRIFMTKKTLYVVVLNARNDTQDHRAEFWLQNIRSVDADAKVILILNKIDMNPRASINENRLRRMYPSLREVVKMSAQDDSKEQFEHNLIRVLKEQIEGFDALSAPFPATWRTVRSKLEASASPYIYGGEFQSYCRDVGIDDVASQDALRIRFSELGISFSCSDTSLLLKPAWVTNAVYKILFNHHDLAYNGILRTSEIEKCLTSSNEAWSVDNTIKYEYRDAPYILEVMRSHKLSFHIGRDNSEFIPLLCERNESELVGEYSNDPFALEIRWQFEYLPDGLLHRLMVERPHELHKDHVWLSGARFDDLDSQSSAIVERTGNMLTIHVRGEMASGNLKSYADKLEQTLRDIIDKEYPSLVEYAESGKEFLNGKRRRYIGIHRLMVHKLNKEKEVFDLDRLESDTNCEYYSSLLYTRISSGDLLEQGYHGIDSSQGLLIRSIVESCRDIQGTSATFENSRNTYIRNLLRSRKYNAYDQTLCGDGKGRNAEGELDMEIRKDSNTPWAIFEALNHRGPKYWKEHLDKLLVNYNPWGLELMFLAVYINDNDFRHTGEDHIDEDFGKIANRYWKDITTYTPDGCECISNSCLDMSGIYSKEASGIRVFRCIYKDSTGLHTVYNILVHIRN